MPRWKPVEDEIAKATGSEGRKPITGRKGNDNKPGGVLSLEVKHGKLTQYIPKKPWDFMEQCLAGIQEDGDPRIPAIAMHPKHFKMGDTLIAFRLRDWWGLVEAILDEYQSSGDLHNYLDNVFEGRRYE